MSGPSKALSWLHSCLASTHKLVPKCSIMNVNKIMTFIDLYKNQNMVVYFLRENVHVKRQL